MTDPRDSFLRSWLRPPRSHRALAVAVIGAALALFFHQGLDGGPGSFIGGIDVANSHFWHRAYLAERMAAFSLPAWAPNFYSGHPFLANPENAVFYPLTLLFVLLPLPLAFTADAVLHVALAAAGTWTFMRRLGTAPAAALFAALAYSLGGYVLDRIFAGHIAYVHVAAWLPWVMYCIDRAVSGNRQRWYVLTGVALALAILGGNPQAAYYVAIAVVCYAATVAAWRRPRRGALRAARRRLARLGLAGAVAAGLCAVQILPTLEFASVSDRAESSYAFATTFSYSFSSLVTLLAPRVQSSWVSLNWEFTAYTGVITLTLAVLGVAFARGRRRVAALCVIALAGMLLALGDNTPAYRVFYAVLPGLDLYRIPARALGIVVFALAALGGLGLDALLRRERTRELLITAAVATVVWALALLVVHETFGVAWSAGLAPAAALCLATLAVLAARLVPGRGAQLAGAGAVALVLADLFVNFAGKVPLVSAAAALAPTPAEQHVLAAPAPVRTALPSGGVRGLVHGYQDVDGNTPLAIGRYIRFMYAMSGVRPNPLHRNSLDDAIFARPRAFLGLYLNVRYMGTAAGGVGELEPALPRAWLVDAVTVERDPQRQLALLRSGELDPRREAVIAQPSPLLPAGPARHGDAPLPYTLDVLHYAPERIEIAVSAERPALLVLSELDYPDWKARVNGRRTEVVTTNYLLRGVALPAGAHRVVFEYRPGSLYIGGALTLLTVLVLLGAWLWTQRRRTPARRPLRRAVPARRPVAAARRSAQVVQRRPRTH